MRRFRCAVPAAVAVVGFVSGASAADLPVKAPVAAPPPVVLNSWTGFYIGANVGGGWSSRSVDYAPNDPALSALFANADFRPPPLSFNTSGVLGGLQLGYNWHLNRNWLVGLEADFDWSGMKGSASTTFGGVPITTTVDEHIKWFGTVRARLGYLPMDNLLAYVTGGFAYGQVEHTGSYVNNSGASFSLSSGVISFNCSPNSTCFAGSSSKVVPGWTLGGGVEYAFWQKWSFKAEYLYVSLDSTSVTETASAVSIPGNTPASFNANFGRTKFNVARVGLNYRF